MYLSILFPSILALLALYRKSLTLGGAILAWLLAIIIYHYGGYIAFIALTSLYLLTMISDKIKKTKKDKVRNINQIISNVLMAGISIILFRYTNNNLFYVIYFSVIAASLSDTLASSIGTLSKKQPINIFTFQKMKTGDSGAVSILGLFISLIGGGIIGCVYLFSKFNIINFIIISLMGFIGSLIDSMLGASFEVKYECVVCHNLTEEKNHCEKNSKVIKGIPLINNNAVNLLSNVLVFIITYIILINLQ